MTNKEWIEKTFPETENWFVEGCKFLKSHGFRPSQFNEDEFYFSVGDDDTGYMSLSVHARRQWIALENGETGWWIDAFTRMPHEDENTMLQCTKYHKDIRDALNEVRAIAEKALEFGKKNAA